MSKYFANFIGTSRQNSDQGSVFKLQDISYLKQSNKWFAGIGTNISGGNVDGLKSTFNSTSWKYHTFTSPGYLTLTEPFTVDILAVGGGGAGGAAMPPSIPSPLTHNVGGGGGAGGVAYANQVVLPSGTYQITVGGGATHADIATGQDTVMVRISDSQQMIIAKGGGTGGFTPLQATGAGTSGGSGGGTATYQNPISIKAATQPLQTHFWPTVVNYGNRGAPTITVPAPPAGYLSVTGGGGAGIGQSGKYHPSGVLTGGGAGGDGIRVGPQPTLDFYGPIIGIPSLAGLSGYYGGGGGGSSWTDYPLGPAPPGISPGPGGLGGGGAGGGENYGGGPGGSQPGTPGTDYSGGGGGASRAQTPGAGASGIFVLRYPVPL